jgi:hypothetical protein
MARVPAALCVMKESGNMQGLYQSEPKVYFRDQNEFRHFLLFDGNGGVQTVSGDFQVDEALKHLKKSTKSIKGEVSFGLLKNKVTLKWLSSGKTPLPDNSNIYEAIVSVVVIENTLIVQSLDADDYNQLSGTYTKIEVN